MTNEFERILDECLDRLGRGESLERCLADYPEYKNELEPLLNAMTETLSAYSFVPSIDAKRSARQKFYAELNRRRQPSFWRRLARPKVAWFSTAGVLALLVLSFVILKPMLWPGVTDTPPDEIDIPDLPSIFVAEPSPDGNFVFLVSDEVNAIAEFSAVDVTIEKVWLLHTGEQEGWVEFIPETDDFNLALLPGEETQQLWRGNVPLGDYTRIVIFVKKVFGTFNETQETIEIKLPSEKLQLKIPFTVSADAVTAFTYDLTVVKTGNAQDGGKYLLKPQAGESGASQSPVSTEPFIPEKDKDKGQGKKD